MKAEYLSPLRVEFHDDRIAVLLEPFSVEIDGLVLTVPAGFRTDFASVPRIPLAFLLTGDSAKHAAVVHDWLYSTGHYPRIWCDDVFAALAKTGGVSAWRRGLMWVGVRIGGGSHFGKNAPVQ